MLQEVLELVVRGVLLGVVYGLIAIPITLVYATTDTVDLAVGGYATLAGVLASVIGGALGVVAGIGAGIAAAAVIGVFFLMVARRADPDPITVALATFGSATAIGSLVLWQWGGDPFVERLFDDVWTVADIRVSPQGVVNLGVACALVAVLYLVMYRTALGRAMRASLGNATGVLLSPTFVFTAGPELAHPRNCSTARVQASRASHSASAGRSIRRRRAGRSGGLRLWHCRRSA